MNSQNGWNVYPNETREFYEINSSFKDFSITMWFCGIGENFSPEKAAAVRQHKTA